MKNRLTKKEKLVIIGGIAALIIGYFSYQSFAGGTTIGISLSNNSNTGNSLATGLVGWWTFDGTTTSSNIADSSGNGNTGYLSGFTSTTTIPGKVGQALKFNGSSNYVNIGSGSSITTAVFTYAAWIYQPDALTFGMIISGNNGDGVQFRRNPTTGFLELDKTGSAIIGISTTAVPSGQWAHVAVSYDASGNVVFYINGIRSNGGTNLQTPVFTGLRIGADSASHFFNGAIDDVRIYNRVLSAAEVKRLYGLGVATHQDVTLTSGGTLPGAPNPNSGLVGYWTFDGTTTISNIADSSGQGNNGTLANFTGTTTVAGRVGQALMFDGINDYINAGDIAAVDAATALTSCAWVNHRTITADNGIMAKWDSVATKGFSFFRDDVGAVSNRKDTYKIFIDDSNSAGTAFIEGASFASPLNKWTHVCFTYQANNASGLRLYVNGVEDANSPASTVGITGIDEGPDGVLIGANGKGGSSTFDGAMDDVRLYTRALSALEIKRLYDLGATTHQGVSVQSNATGATGINSGLIGYWTFDGKNSLQNFIDSSGNGNNGYLTNSVSTTTVPGKIGQALDFDGVDDYIKVPNATSMHPSLPVTFSAWIYADSGVPLQSGIFSTDETSFVAHNWTGIIFQTNGSGQFGSQYGNNTTCGPTGRRSATGGTVLQPKKWYHVAAVVRGATDVSIFVNGVAETVTYSGSGGSPAYTTNPGSIGIFSNCSAGEKFDFPGKIDDVRFYNYALSTSSILRLYQLGK